MRIKIYDIDIDLDNEIDCNYFHEYMLYEKYKHLESLQDTDIYTKIFKKDVKQVLENKIKTGSWNFAKDIVYSYDTERFENVSKDFTMCWKKTTANHDKLIIHLTSFAGHEGRLTSPLTNVSDKIINLDTDLLIVNEDPLRFPESTYPSMMVLGCSDENNTQEKMCNQIRSYIKKDYRKVIIYADSKHAGSALSIGYKLNDIVTNVFVTGGMATYSWHHSPWIKGYLKWLNRGYHLKDQKYPITNVQAMYIIKCWKFKQLNVASEIIDPFRFVSDYPNIKVDYLYGKYDKEYVEFISYIKQFDSENLSMKEIDYKISDNQTHNIRPYVDRKILKEFIESL